MLEICTLRRLVSLLNGYMNARCIAVFLAGTQVFCQGLSRSEFVRNPAHMFELTRFPSERNRKQLSKLNYKLCDVFYLHFKGEWNLRIMLLCLF